MNRKNTIIEHYKKFFDLHAKGIALDEDDHLNIDWADDLVKNCFIPDVVGQSTSKLFEKYFGNTTSVDFKHPNIEAFFEELNAECLTEDKQKNCKSDTKLNYMKNLIEQFEALKLEHELPNDNNSQYNIGFVKAMNIAINAVKNCNLPPVVGQSEQLKDFVDWWHGLSQEELAWYEGRYVEVFESL